MIQIIFYQKQNGKFPVKDFLDELERTNPQMYSKVWLKIKLLVINQLGNEDIKYIGEKIYELRIKQSSNISRVFYLTFKDEKIVLLDGIIKKTQKLDNSVIGRIITYKKDFLKRNIL